MLLEKKRIALKMEEDKQEALIQEGEIREDIDGALHRWRDVQVEELRSRLAEYQSLGPGTEGGGRDGRGLS